MKLTTLIDWQRMTHLWIILFVFITPLMIVAPAAVSTQVSVQTTKIPVGQLAELIIPFTIIAFVYAGMLGAFLNNQRVTLPALFWLAVSFCALGFLGMGLGIHFSAQTLNQFVMTNQILGELRSVAHLFNERLTHLLWLPPLLFFPTIILGWELLYEIKSLPTKLSGLPTLFLATGSGGWYGLLIGLAILESQLAPQALQGLLLILGVNTTALFVRRKYFSFSGILSTVAIVTMLSLILLWRLRYGGFPEPLDVLL